MQWVGVALVALSGLLAFRAVGRLRMEKDFWDASSMDRAKIFSQGARAISALQLSVAAVLYLTPGQPFTPWASIFPLALMGVIFFFVSIGLYQGRFTRRFIHRVPVLNVFIGLGNLTRFGEAWPKWK
jgi:hypothetical protein